MVETLTATDETRAADLSASIDIRGSHDDEPIPPDICDVVQAIRSFLDQGGVARAFRAEALLRARQGRGLGLFATQQGLESAFAEIKYSPRSELNTTFDDLIARAEEIAPSKTLRPDTSELVQAAPIDRHDVDQNNRLAKEIDAALERGDTVAALELLWQLDAKAPTINSLNSAEHLLQAIGDEHPSRTETLSYIRSTAIQLVEQCSHCERETHLQRDAARSLVDAAIMTEDAVLAAKVSALVATSTTNLRQEQVVELRRDVTPYVGTEPMALAA